MPGDNGFLWVSLNNLNHSNWISVFQSFVPVNTHLISPLKLIGNKMNHYLAVTFVSRGKELNEQAGGLEQGYSLFFASRKLHSLQPWHWNQQHLVHLLVVFIRGASQQDWKTGFKGMESGHWFFIQSANVRLCAFGLFVFWTCKQKIQQVSFGWDQIRWTI